MYAIVEKFSKIKIISLIYNEIKFLKIGKVFQKIFY